MSNRKHVLVDAVGSEQDDREAPASATGAAVARQRRTRLTAVLLACAVMAGLIALAITLSSFEGDRTEGDSALDSPPPKADDLIVASTTLESYPAGLLEGELALVRGCFLLNDWRLVLPPGTSLLEQGPTIQLPSGTRSVIGDRVALPGGLVPMTSDVADMVGGEAAAALRACSSNSTSNEVALIAP